MNKRIKKALILGLVLCLILAATLLAACNKTPDEPPTTPKILQYTVMVNCEYDGVLDNVSVKLNKADGTLAGEKALEEGKATFELESGDYTVELAGLPEGYGYSAATLTKDSTSCTITVNGPVAYTVSVTYPDIKNIYGSTVKKAGAARGLTVLLYEGKLQDDRGDAIEDKTPAATAVTDNGGMARFTLAGDVYTIVIPEYEHGLEIYYPLKSEGVFVNTVTRTNPYFAVTFNQRYLYGEEESVPIQFALGENSVPLTYELLTGTLEESSSAFYSFTPEKTSNYTFTATGNAKVGSQLFGAEPLTSKKSVVVHMEAGVTYAFSCGISSTEGSLAYTVKIEEGGEIDDGAIDSAHSYPWTQGSGTLSAPFTTTSLEGEYTDLYVLADNHFYLAYTPAANESYTFSEIGDNLWLQIYDDVANIPSRMNWLIELGGETTSEDCDLKAGTTYYFLIGTMDDKADAVGFKAEKKAGGNTPSGEGKETYTVTVVGKDASGNIEPIEGISVTIRDVDQTTKTTDAQGKVSFEVEPTATGYGILLGNIPANYRDDNDFAFSVSHDKPDLTITLTKIENVRTVSITVKYADGRLAEQGLTVRLIASNNSQTDAKTDANGVARFYVPDDTYQVQVPLFATDGGIHDNGPQLNSGQQFHFLKYTVEVKGSDVSLETAYDYTRSVDVTVKNADGTVVVGATVEIVDAYDKSYETDTGDNGVAHFDNVIEGEFDVFVTYNGKGEKAKLTVKGGVATLTVTLS